MPWSYDCPDTRAADPAVAERVPLVAERVTAYFDNLKFAVYVAFASAFTLYEAVVLTCLPSRVQLEN